KRLKIDGNIIMDANAEIVLYRLHGKLRPKVRLAQFTEYQRRVDPLELVVARDLDIQVAWNAEDTDAVFRWIETDQHDSIRPKGQTGFAGATVKAHHQHREARCAVPGCERHAATIAQNHLLAICRSNPTQTDTRIYGRRQNGSGRRNNFPAFLRTADEQGEAHAQNNDDAQHGNRHDDPGPFPAAPGADAAPPRSITDC